MILVKNLQKFLKVIYFQKPFTFDLKGSNLPILQPTFSQGVEISIEIVKNFL